jgi:hypothetical protein
VLSIDSDKGASRRLRMAWQDAFPSDQEGRRWIPGLCERALKYVPPSQSPVPPKKWPTIKQGGQSHVHVCNQETRVGTGMSDPGALTASSDPGALTASSSSTLHPRGTNANPFQYALCYAPQSQTPQAPSQPPM